MSAFTQLLLRLGLSYSLMRREEFVEHLTKLLEDKGIDPNDTRAVSELFFKELNFWLERENIKNAVKNSTDHSDAELINEIKDLKNQIAELKKNLEGFKK